MSLTFQKEGHLYFYDEVEKPSVSKILEVGGFVDYSMVPPDILQSTSVFGHVLHDTCRLHDIGRLKSCDEGIEPYLQGWIKFKKDTGITFYLVEDILYSKTWNFAGTPDRVGRTGKIDVIVDIKSGGIEKHHGLQVGGGYEILVEENMKTKIKISWTVKLLPGSYKIVPHSDPTLRAVFIGAVQGYHWKKRNGVLK